MNIKKLLQVIIPVCVMSMASCTNEEIIIGANESQRGRAFAESFQAKFDNIDPNHTWVDGSVGNVLVTTPEKANVVIYGVGLEDHTLLRLKQCVIEGTQEVKYDIPKGCRSIVLRAYNSKMNEYRTLDPSNEYDEAMMVPGLMTRAGSTATTLDDFITEKPARARQLIPNVWNGYGTTAPWQTSIPNIAGITPVKQTGNNAKEYDFYFAYNGTDYKMKVDGIYNNNGIFPNFIPASMFANDEAFLEATGFSANDQDVKWKKVSVEYGQGSWGNISAKFTITDKNNESQLVDLGWELKTKDMGGNDVRLPEIAYYNYVQVGKYTSWWRNKDFVPAQFYIASMDITNNQEGSLKDADYYYTRNDLNNPIVDEIIRLVEVDNQYDLLKPFVSDRSMTTTAEGPVSISWFFGMTSTRDYIGYYYTVGEDTQEARNNAARYLLLDAYSGARQKGDTFPLTYYGPDGNDAPTYTFPAGVHIHFFITHGRGSNKEWYDGEKHPQSLSEWKGWVSQDDWLFYDTATNGWTLNAWYNAYAEGSRINEPPLSRLFGENGTGAPDERIITDFDGNFIPSMGFDYGGYNVIGFEDTPDATNLDWNDCVFLLNGNFDIVKFNEKDICFTMCMEDLGDTDDLDYNDLIMTVKQGYEEMTVNGETTTSYSAPVVSILGAGGLVPMKVAFESEDTRYEHLNKTLFEDVHKAFGVGYENVIINTFDPEVYNNGTFNGTYNDGEVVRVTFNDGVILRCVKGLAPVTATWTNSEFGESDIAGFSILDNVHNFKVYVDYGEGETLCISSPKNVTSSGYQDDTRTDKTPYAFWFPQTVDGEGAPTLPMERQFVTDALPGFAEWVANQNHTGDKWYNWKWGSTEGWEPTETGQEQVTGGGTYSPYVHDEPGFYDEPSAPQVKTTTITANNWEIGTLWNNPYILIKKDYLLSNAKKISVTYNLKEGASGNVALYTSSGNELVKEEAINGRTSVTLTFDQSNSNFGYAINNGFGACLWQGLSADMISSIIIESDAR